MTGYDQFKQDMAQGLGVCVGVIIAVVYWGLRLSLSMVVVSLGLVALFYGAQWLNGG